MNKFLRSVLVSLFAFGAVIASAHANQKCLPDCASLDEAAADIPDGAYPFRDKYVMIDGIKVHYVEHGHGKPIVFVHGHPTWSYAYRNIFPEVAKNTKRRAIAVDLPGFGRSDKPNINYSPQFFVDFLAKFVDKLKLDGIVFVGQDWGAAFFANYAELHPEKVEGLVFMEESFLWKFPISDFGPFAPFIQFLRTPQGQDTIVNNKTFFVETLLKGGVLHPDHFTQEIFNGYLEPFPTTESRTMLAAIPIWLPLVDDPGTPKFSLDFFDDITSRLGQLRSKPLLWLRGTPGVLAPDNQGFANFRAQLPNLDIRDFGPGLHPLQEDNPEKLVCMISQWIFEKDLNGKRGQH